MCQLRLKGFTRWPARLLIFSALLDLVWVVAAEKREGGILWKGVELACSTDRKEPTDARPALVREDPGVAGSLARRGR